MKLSTSRKKVNPNTFDHDLNATNVWYLDNGASNHMNGNRMFFVTLDETITGQVRFGDDSRIDIRGKGSIQFVFREGEKKILNNVYYIPGLKSNIISLGQATEAGCEVRMRDDILTLFDRYGKVMVKTTRSKNRLYKVVLDVDNHDCLKLSIKSESSKWHARLGHINTDTMKAMINKELVTGVPAIAIEGETCMSCLLGKQARKPFPQKTTYRASYPLDLIHGDLCGPITPPTPAHKRYVFVLIDDHTRYMWTMLLKEKSEAFDKFKKFKVLVEQETKLTVKTFRSDRGGEFCSTEFQEYCDKNGVKRHLTAPYSPQQNGVVERRNRTLLEMTRSIMKHMKVPNMLWGEAVRHSTYLINRIATKSLADKTPYEALRARKPDISHLKVFGCVCYARTNTVGRKKLDDRSKILVHLGTEPGSKAYRLLDTVKKKIIVSRDVFFVENEGWNWDSDHSNGYNDGGTFAISVKNTNRDDIEGKHSEEEAETEPIIEEVKVDNENEESDTEDNQEHPRRSSRISTKPAYLDDYILIAETECERLLMIINDEPWDFTEAKEL